MKRWALLTVALYALALIVLAGPMVVVAFLGEGKPWPTFKQVYTIIGLLPEINTKVSSDGLEIMGIWPLWSWVALMALAEAAMLVVPIRIAQEKIVSTKWLLWPFLAAFVLLLLMAWSMYMALVETLAHTQGVGSAGAVIAPGVVFCVWTLWAILFGFYTTRQDAKTTMSRICRFLVAGSILELLVAVPAHVLARSRSYCCAGAGTFWGIATGISVMLLAFGPAVFVLFARRYKATYHRKRSVPGSPGAGGDPPPGAPVNRR